MRRMRRRRFIIGRGEAHAIPFLLHPHLRRQWAFGVHTTVMVRGRRLFAKQASPGSTKQGKRCAQSFGKPFDTSVVSAMDPVTSRVKFTEERVCLWGRPASSGRCAS